MQWLAGVVCTQNFDGFVHNYSLYLNSETGLFEIMPWDFDATWGRDINGIEMPYDYVRCQGFNTLSARLLDLPYYQDMYIDILTEILNGITPKYMSSIIHDHFNKLLPYVADDRYIKGHSDLFAKESDFILTFIKKRNKFLKGDLDKWAAGLGKS